MLVFLYISQILIPLWLGSVMSQSICIHGNPSFDVAVLFKHLMWLFCPFKDYMSSVTPFGANKETNPEIHRAEPLQCCFLLAKARSLRQEAPVTHVGARFIREELWMYKSTCQRRKSGWTRGEMHTTNTFAPLCAGSPVFGGSHHIIINYADNFPYKLFQPQLLVHLRGEIWSPQRRRMSRELGFQENRTYGTVRGESTRASVSTQGNICSRVKIQLSYASYWERQ